MSFNIQRLHSRVPSSNGIPSSPVSQPPSPSMSDLVQVLEEIQRLANSSEGPSSNLSEIIKIRNENCELRETIAKLEMRDKAKNEEIEMLKIKIRVIVNLILGV